MVTVTGELEPDAKRHEMYTDLYGIFGDTMRALKESGIYDRLAETQGKYWGS